MAVLRFTGRHKGADIFNETSAGDRMSKPGQVWHNQHGWTVAVGPALRELHREGQLPDPQPTFEGLVREFERMGHKVLFGRPRELWELDQ